MAQIKANLQESAMQSVMLLKSIDKVRWTIQLLTKVFFTNSSKQTCARCLPEISTSDPVDNCNPLNNNLPMGKEYVIDENGLVKDDIGDKSQT